ncbi:Crp/Fnr family transcriptional regulator [Pedobacter sp. 22163]|uniref:Crp/Fnr family transcriptional regulator n=1 Tax=Pedobacter sp. 22163 TaxID=3453883 RepID=UPI003F839AD6
MKQSLSNWYNRLTVKYPIVSDHEWELLDSMTKKKVIKKGESFLHHGRVARYAAFVCSGQFKFTIDDEDGNEKIIRFAFEDDFIANCESFYSKSPSAIRITAIEDSEIRRFSIKKLQPLYDLHMSIASVNLDIYQDLAEKTFEHQYLLSLKSPVKRYKYLLENRPLIIKKISLTNIARYLYVSREAISRARLFLLNKSQNFCD